MPEYINHLIETILRKCRSQQLQGVIQQLGRHSPDSWQLLRALSTELQRLDPRDFEPVFRQDFIILRLAIDIEAHNDAHDGNIPDLVAKMPPILAHYAGEGTLAKTRDFSFMTNSDVHTIVERDYRELNLRAFPDGAWKSTVILAGSILEAVLYDRLTKDGATIAQAMGAKKAPERKKGIVKDIQKRGRANEWSLSDLIKVSSELGFLPPENEIAIDQVLREYRNFVHPRVEVEKGIAITEGHATASKGMLEVILDELK